MIRGISNGRSKLSEGLACYRRGTTRNGIQIQYTNHELGRARMTNDTI